MLLKICKALEMIGWMLLTCTDSLSVTVPFHFDGRITYRCHLGIQMGFFALHDRQIIKWSSERGDSIAGLHLLQLLLLLSAVLNVLQIDSFRVLFAPVKISKNKLII